MFPLAVKPCRSALILGERRLNGIRRIAPALQFFDDPCCRAQRVVRERKSNGLRFVLVFVVIISFSFEVSVQLANPGLLFRRPFGLWGQPSSGADAVHMYPDKRGWELAGK